MIVTGVDDETVSGKVTASSVGELEGPTPNTNCPPADEVTSTEILTMTSQFALFCTAPPPTVSPATPPPVVVVWESIGAEIKKFVNVESVPKELNSSIVSCTYS